MIVKAVAPQAQPFRPRTIEITMETQADLNMILDMALQFNVNGVASRNTFVEKLRVAVLEGDTK